MPKRISWILVVVLVICNVWVPLPVQAQEKHIEFEGVYINPLYEESIDEEMFLAELEVICEANDNIPALKGDTYYDVLEDAADYMREQMVLRVNTIEFQIPGVWCNEERLLEIWDLAMVHTESCTGQEGDTLRWSHKGMTVGAQGTTVMCTVTYKVLYDTTFEQEQEMTAAIDEAIQSMDLDEASDYDKINKIYKYIADNVNYDYSLEKHSAYDAMCTGTAVCEGYALLCYRMYKDVGISVRIISGDGGGPHAWNIVKLGDYYYNIDCTWDGQDEITWDDFFLKNQEDFVGHTRDAEFDTVEFHEEYPMALKSWGEEVEPTPAPTVAPTIEPTATPTVEPTATPTVAPSATPTVAPTATPTVEPTATPTVAPSATPTVAPTATPTVEPSATPTVAPTATPTVAPTATPTVEPTATPTVAPSATPTVAPTATPTVAPTETPTVEPSATPTVAPSATPTVAPTATPTVEPTATPTIEPTATPTVAPTATPAPPVEDTFIDIKEGAWYVQYVQYVFENGLMNGTSENSFEPDSTLTREMFAQILYSQAGKPKVTASNPFSDVEEGTWYRDAVVWAYSNGIVSGVVDTPTEKKFGVETPITREQLALMMYRYAEKTGMDMGVEENVFAGFGDTDEVSDWATDGVGWAISHSIMKGKPNTDNTMILDPLGKATRAECATMVMNLVTMKD